MWWFSVSHYRMQNSCGKEQQLWWRLCHWKIGKKRMKKWDLCGRTSDVLNFLSLRLISMSWNNCGNDFLDLMVMHWPLWILCLNRMKVLVETSYSSKSSSPYYLRSLFFVMQTSIPAWRWLDLFKWRIGTWKCWPISERGSTQTLSLSLREYPSWSILEIKSHAQIPWKHGGGTQQEL